MIKSFVLGLVIGTVVITALFKLSGAGGIWWYATGGYVPKKEVTE